MFKILIIHPEGNISNNPNLFGIVEILCEKNYSVHIYSPKRENVYQQSPCAGATLFLHPPGPEFLTAGLVTTTGENPAEYEPQIRTLNASRGPYDLVVGVDRGIIEAFRYAKTLNIPCGLISYEIFFTEEAGEAFKRPEREACRSIDFAVCQDDVRAGCLSIENGIPRERIIHIPVAGRGCRAGEKGRYLYDALQIDRSKKIALFMGSIAPWSMAGFIMESAAGWSDDWVLVVHSRYGRDGILSGYMEKFKHCDRIRFSLNPVADPNGMARIIHCADVGIALYKPQYASIWDGNNLKYMGMSSGKISTFLQHGTPVVVNETGEMSRYVAGLGLGWVVDDRRLFGLPAKVENPTAMQAKCRAFFSLKLDLDRTIIPLLDVLKRLLPAKGEAVGRGLRLAREGKNLWDRRRDVAESSGTVPRPGGAPPSGVSAWVKKPAEFPKITMVTPSYNQGEYLEECIDSILGQGYPNLEYIIMDGGSTDHSPAIIKKYEKYLAYRQSEPDGGQYWAVNEGFKRSGGEIMGWLNSDDKLHPGSLSIVSTVFKARREIEWIMGRPTGWDESGNLEYCLDPLPVWSRNDFFQRKFGSFFIQQESTFWRRSLWDRAGGGLDLGLVHAADFELWARFFRFAQLYSVDALLGGFRRHSEQKTASILPKYMAEAHGVIDREIALFEKSSSKALPPPPEPVDIGATVSQSGERITEQNFSYFTYSKKTHFSFFKEDAVAANNKIINPKLGNLANYRNMLVYSFIINNIPKGSKILGVGKHGSGIFNALSNSYELSVIDFADANNEDTNMNIIKSLNVIPDSSFDFIFSLSLFDDIVSIDARHEKICHDMMRIMKPGSCCVHCINAFYEKNDPRKNEMIPWLFSNFPAVNSFIPFRNIAFDPQVYAVTGKPSDLSDTIRTRKDFFDRGGTFSCNILWMKSGLHDPGGKASPGVAPLLKENKSFFAGERPGGERPGVSPSSRIDAAPGLVEPLKVSSPVVSAVVSTHASERFMRGLLEDLTSQTLADRLEIIVVDSGSPENERGIVEEFSRRFGNIRYVRTERESIYAAWNRGIAMARGRYVTNANTDDRHRRDALEVMARTLDARPDVDLVYGDYYISHVANEIFEKNSGNEPFRGPEFFAPDALIEYQFGPQPVWRRSVHERIGLFDERYRIVGDYDFNIRFALEGKAFHIPEFLGLYLKHGAALSFESGANTTAETLEVRKRYRTMENIERAYVREGFPAETEIERAAVRLDMGIRILAHYSRWIGITEKIRASGLCREARISPELQAVRDRLAADLGASLPGSGSLDSYHFLHSLQQDVALHVEFALECFRAASALRPSWEAAYNNMAVAFHDKGGTAEGIEILRRAAKLLPHETLRSNLALLESLLRGEPVSVPPELLPSGLETLSRRPETRSI